MVKNNLYKKDLKWVFFVLTKLLIFCYALLRQKGEDKMASTLTRHRKWNVEVDQQGDHPYKIYTRGPDGEKAIREVVPDPDQDGAPIIVAEPDLAFDPPANLEYVNAKGKKIQPDQKIVGVVCQNGPRLSLTDAKTMGINIFLNEDGSLQVGEETWWIASLFIKDSKSFRGYEAICVQEKQEGEGSEVDILEIGDILDKSSSALNELLGMLSTAFKNL